jgi:hypothetical protein
MIFKNLINVNFDQVLHFGNKGLSFNQGKYLIIFNLWATIY